MDTKKTLFVAVCFIFFASTTSALQCYVCNSHTHAECFSTESLTAAEDKFLKDCDSLDEQPRSGASYTYCRKIEQDIPARHGHEATTRVIRQCGYYNTTVNSCYKAGLINGGRQIVCSCSEDGCNGTEQLPHMGPLSMFAIAALLLVGNGKLFH